MKKELLLPVGSIEAFKSALLVPADAVYLGYKSFSARKRAKNFFINEIRDIIYNAHRAGIKVYITLNTILFSGEVKKIVTLLYFLSKNPPDAVIIQDFGLYYILKKYFPTTVVHASTQMNNYDIECISFFEKLGFKRVICARETTMYEMKNMNDLKIEIEGFVHGAHCVSYSGLCYFSFYRGKRSGNRGNCAQPCRLMYEYEDKKFTYLSPRDLCLIDIIQEYPLRFLKVEGRLKSPNYVYWVGKSYKEKLFNKSSDNYVDGVFHREFSHGCINFRNPHNFLNAKSDVPGKLVGVLLETKKNFIVAKLQKEIFVGCGIISNNINGIITKIVKKKNDIYKLYGRFKKGGIKGKEIYLTSYPLPEDIKKIKIDTWYENIFLDLFIYPEKNIQLKFNNELFEIDIIPDVSISGKSPIDKIKKKLEIFKDERIRIFCNIHFSKPFFLTYKSINDLKSRIHKIITVIRKKEIKELRKKVYPKIWKARTKYKKILRIMNNIDLINSNSEYDFFYVHVSKFDDAIKVINIDKIIPYFFPVEYLDKRKEILRLKNIGVKKILVGDTGTLNVAMDLKMRIHIDYFIPVTNHMTIKFFEDLNCVENIIINPELPLKEYKFLDNTNINLTFIYKMKPILFFTGACLFNQFNIKKESFILKGRDGDIEIKRYRCLNIAFDTKIRNKRVPKTGNINYLLYDFWN